MTLCSLCVPFVKLFAVEALYRGYTVRPYSLQARPHDSNRGGNTLGDLVEILNSKSFFAILIFFHVNSSYGSPDHVLKLGKPTARQNML